MTEKAKVMSPHRILHSSVTVALEATNGDVRRVQKLSRHANLNTLMIYDEANNVWYIGKSKNIQKCWQGAVRAILLDTNRTQLPLDTFPVTPNCFLDWFN